MFCVFKEEQRGSSYSRRSTAESNGRSCGPLDHRRGKRWSKLTQISGGALGFPVEKRQGREKYMMKCRSREVGRGWL